MKELVVLMFVAMLLIQNTYSALSGAESWSFELRQNTEKQICTIVARNAVGFRESELWKYDQTNTESYLSWHQREGRYLFMDAELVAACFDRELTYAAIAVKIKTRNVSNRLEPNLVDGYGHFRKEWDGYDHCVLFLRKTKEGYWVEKGGFMLNTMFPYLVNKSVRQLQFNAEMDLAITLREGVVIVHQAGNKLRPDPFNDFRVDHTDFKSTVFVRIHEDVLMGAHEAEKYFVGEGAVWWIEKDNQIYREGARNSIMSVVDNQKRRMNDANVKVREFVYLPSARKEQIEFYKNLLTPDGAKLPVLLERL